MQHGFSFHACPPLCVCGSWASNVSERIRSAFSWDLVSLLQLPTGEGATAMFFLVRVIQTSETKREQR